jgi:hypothetical protein
VIQLQRVAGIGVLARGLALGALAFVQLVILPLYGLHNVGEAVQSSHALAAFVGARIPAVIGVLHVVLALGGALAALAIHEKLTKDAPTTVLVATTFGLIASGIFLAEGIASVVAASLFGSALQGGDAEARAAYRAAMGVGWGFFLAGLFAYGLWVALVSASGLRSKGLPTAFCWLGLVWGTEAILAPASSVLSVPLLGTVWSIWLGIVLLKAGR